MPMTDVCMWTVGSGRLPIRNLRWLEQKHSRSPPSPKAHFTNYPKAPSSLYYLPSRGRLFEATDSAGGGAARDVRQVFRTRNRLVGNFPIIVGFATSFCPVEAPVASSLHWGWQVLAVVASANTSFISAPNTLSAPMNAHSTTAV
jgi:hypothetical protein